MSPRKIAVVLFNLGGPDQLASVRPFLFNLFNDKAIIALPQPFRAAVAWLISTLRDKTARATYALMGGASPLLKETDKQAQALQAVLAARLPEAQVQTVIAMRYWKPFVSDAARTVQAFAPDEIVLAPLYPQFSTTTTGSSLRAWTGAYKGPGVTRKVCCYPEEAGLVEAHARRILATYTALGSPRPLRLLFSAHGLPQAVIDAGDPYQAHIERTAAAVLARLGPDWAAAGWDWRVCYQSRVGPMKWLGPSTIDALQEAAADGRGVLVTPIAFVSEHVETLVELDHEYAGLARQLALPFYLRAPAVGDDLAFIEGLADTVIAALDRPGVGPQGAPCGSGLAKCPFIDGRQLRGGVGVTRESATTV
jgi:ferrochelatase